MEIIDLLHSYMERLIMSAYISILISATRGKKIKKKVRAQGK